MKLTVFGATGRTGRLVLDEGVRRGHQTTAFTRRPDNLTGVPGLAAVVSGDGRDADAVREAVTGADGVIAILGAATRKGPHQVAEVSTRLTEAMAELGARRLVITSAYPIVGDHPRLLVAILRRVLADSYADSAEMERIVMSTDLDWTIARLTRLLDKPARGGVRVHREVPTRPTSITRADAATTLLDLVADDEYAKAAVTLTG